jgi:hypothetical protein
VKLVPLTPRHIQILAALTDEQMPAYTNIVGTCCVTENGWPVALGGAFLNGREAEVFAFFGDIRRVYPVTIAHMVIGFLNKLPELGVEVVVAYPDPIDKAERFLEWLGFRPSGVVNEKGVQYERWVSLESSPSSAASSAQWDKWQPPHSKRQLPTGTHNDSKNRTAAREQ